MVAKLNPLGISVHSSVCRTLCQALGEGGSQHLMTPGPVLRVHEESRVGRAPIDSGLREALLGKGQGSDWLGFRFLGRGRACC